jgi:hypothetical protein
MGHSFSGLKVLIRKVINKINWDLTKWVVINIKVTTKFFDYNRFAAPHNICQSKELREEPIR